MTDATLQAHVWLVDSLAPAGIEPPREWSLLRSRFDEVAGMERRCLGKLISEVLHPAGGDLALLRAAAVAEVRTSDVTDQVGARVHEELGRIYAPHATKNYKTVAAKFDSIAKEFTAAARIVDVEYGAATIVEADPKHIEVWRSAPALAEELDRLLDPLAAAAELAGAPGDLMAMDFDAALIQLPLTVNVEGQHRRRLWRAWHALPAEQPDPGPLTTVSMLPEAPPASRCRRWSRLIYECRAIIRAHPNPSELELFTVPQPVGVKFVPRRDGGHDMQRFDPEDEPAHPSVVKRLAGALTGRNNDHNDDGSEIP
jgi:hypothetical protein